MGRLFKSEDSKFFNSYRAISALRVFIKIIENLYKHFKSSDPLTEKQFVFKLNNSTEYVILQIIREVNCKRKTSFQSNENLQKIITFRTNFKWMNSFYINVDQQIRSTSAY